MRSPAEQKSELVKLAAREGCEIIEWCQDDAITGDSGSGTRPGLAALLRCVESGKAKVVLAWHTNRLSRQDPFDAVEFYNRLRKAGVTVITHDEGRLDLDDFGKQLLVFVGQKANKDYLLELSAKVLRGQLSNGKAGRHNGGPSKFALDRVLVDASGNVVRRLQSGECVRQAGHHMQLVPTDDPDKLAAVKYAFTRFASADLGVRRLAGEMNGKGYPSPSGKGWNTSTLAATLRNPAYCGASRWGLTSRGKYHVLQGEEIVSVANGNGNASDGKRRFVRKPPEEAIVCKGAHQGIIPPALFAKVQRRLDRRAGHRHAARGDFVLSGIVFCGHCGRPMHGHSCRRPDRHGTVAYRYHQYICPSYADHGHDPATNPTGCGHYTIDAAGVLGWLVHGLQSLFLGPGRESLVAACKRQLTAKAKDTQGDGKRLAKRLGELDAEIGRLVRAIRTTDVAELASELGDARRERDSVKAELDRAARYSTPEDLDAEAERVAREVWQLGQALGDADPATTRELLGRCVARIDCRWEKAATPKGRTRCRLVGGEAILREETLLGCLSSSDTNALA